MVNNTPRKGANYSKVGNNNTMFTMQRLLSVTEINCKGYKFLITERPTEEHLGTYYRILRNHNVKALIRVCEDMYDPTLLTLNGIEVHDMPLEDGSYPSKKIAKNFCSLVKEVHSEDQESCIAIHCVSGLGRAPAMVAVALTELGMDNLDAVDLLRNHRKGVLNAKQIVFLENYKPGRTLKPNKMLKVFKTWKKLSMYFRNESM